MAGKQATLIILAKQKAESGVDYSPRHGALCPWCKRQVKIYSTKPWEGLVRIRYHRCENPSCVIGRMGVTIKSLEQDLTGVGGKQKKLAAE